MNERGKHHVIVADRSTERVELICHVLELVDVLQQISPFVHNRLDEASMEKYRVFYAVLLRIPF